MALLGSPDRTKLPVLCAALRQPALSGMELRSLPAALWQLTLDLTEYRFPSLRKNYICKSVRVSDLTSLSSQVDLKNLYGKER